MKISSRYLAASLLVLATACGSKSTSSGLSVSAHASAAAAAATSAGLALPDGITISRIRMAVQQISVEDPQSCGTTAAVTTAEEGGSGSGSSGSGGGDDGSGDGCSGELSFGPFDLDLAGSALDGSVDFAFDAPIPAGTYGEIAIRLDTVPASLAGGNPVLEELAAAHASIIVDGFVEDAPSTVRPFTFSTPLEATQKREGAIVIGPGSNVTLDFDPSHWFDGSAGRLDPSDPSAQAEILANIRASIRILKDHDHDGRDDDDESESEHATAGHP